MGTFEPAWLESVPPPRDAVDDRAYQAGLDRLAERGQLDLAGVWYWTRRLEDAGEVIQEQLTGVRFVSRLAAGFLEELGGTFGVVAYAEEPAEAAAIDPGALDPGDRSLVIDDHSFPLLVRTSVREQHWCTAPHVIGPSSARATCWVRSPARGYAGWLVPRHAVVPLTAATDFSDGGSGRVVDHFGECIDAIVVTTTVPPRSVRKARACWPVVAGQSLEVTDSPGSHVSATVVDADLNLGVLRVPVFPIRFSTDWTGHAGQSGALVVEPISGQPAGAYLGVLRPSLAGYVPPRRTAPPPSTGYAQSCYQLEAAAGMEFYL